MDFIKDLKHGHNKAEQQQEQPPPPPPPEHHRGFLDRLGDAVDDLGGKPQHHDTPPPPPPPPKKDNIFEKIGDALKGEDYTPPPPPPPPKPEGFFDKISDAIHGHEKHEQPPKPATFSEKVGDRMNNALGGGASGEAKEDHLDKGFRILPTCESKYLHFVGILAIDFYQEHVLKQGKQDDESAIEQAKDKQIASVIRHGFESVTGKELPSSHGHHKE
jgi:hypothetical protein